MTQAIGTQYDKAMSWAEATFERAQSYLESLGYHLDHSNWLSVPGTYVNMLLIDHHISNLPEIGVYISLLEHRKIADQSKARVVYGRITITTDGVDIKIAPNGNGNITVFRGRPSEAHESSNAKMMLLVEQMQEAMSTEPFKTLQ